MAEPKLEIERRLDRLEEAIRVVAKGVHWLDTDFDDEKIDRILEGTEESENASKEN